MNRFVIGNIVKGNHTGTIYEILDIRGDYVDVLVITPNVERHTKGNVIKGQYHRNFGLYKEYIDYEIY